MFGTLIALDPKTRRRTFRFPKHRKKRSLWSGSEAEPTYRVMGENYVVLNVEAEPLKEDFVPTHKLRAYLAGAAESDAA